MKRMKLNENICSKVSEETILKVMSISSNGHTTRVQRIMTKFQERDDLGIEQSTQDDFILDSYFLCPPE